MAAEGAVEVGEEEGGSPADGGGVAGGGGEEGGGCGWRVVESGEWTVRSEE